MGVQTTSAPALMMLRRRRGHHQGVRLQQPRARPARPVTPRPCDPPHPCDSPDSRDLTIGSALSH
eukprot:594576-Pyramimonas_sp.AAC.1